MLMKKVMQCNCTLLLHQIASSCFKLAVKTRTMVLCNGSAGGGGGEGEGGALAEVKRGPSSRPNERKFVIH